MRYIGFIIFLVGHVVLVRRIWSEMPRIWPMWYWANPFFTIFYGLFDLKNDWWAVLAIIGGASIFYLGLER